MADDYFYSSQQRPAAAGGGHPSASPYYEPQQRAPSLYSTPAPSYHRYPDNNSHSPSPSYSPGPYGAPSNQPPSRTSAQSPFDTVFDDHIYPMNSQPPAVTNTGDVSQHGGFYHQDTGYYGASRPRVAEDIPLQDQPGKPPNVNDHVYDAPAGQAQNNPRVERRGKIRPGELGMLGANRKRIPWMVYLFSLIQVGVFIGEIVKNSTLTGSPIMIKPSFNPMIGPSTQVMIYMGARYAPCMHNIKEIQGSTNPVLFLCPNATENTQICPLSEVCGFGGVPNPLFNGDANQSPRPDQWFRFIVPIFMHAGIVHIGFNLLLQLTVAKEMEVAIGPIRFFLVYLSSGIFGFVMGGNFAAPGIASTGASGSLFGIIALTLIDLLYSWKDRRSPVKDLMFIILDMVISFVLGLLPGLDNFSHIGGFLMGLALGVCLLHSPNSLRRRLGQDPSYSAVPGALEPGMVPFHKSPVGFFKGRKPLWWVWWLIRAAALLVIIAVFIVLLNNFYKVGNTCGWCKYLSCIPVNGWCDLGTIQDQSS